MNICKIDGLYHLDGGVPTAEMRWPSKCGLDLRRTTENRLIGMDNGVRLPDPSREECCRACFGAIFDELDKTQERIKAEKAEAVKRDLDWIARMEGNPNRTQQDDIILGNLRKLHADALIAAGESLPSSI